MQRIEDRTLASKLLAKTNAMNLSISKKAVLYTGILAIVPEIISFASSSKL
jgi:hypothetical protein